MEQSCSETAYLFSDGYVGDPFSGNYRCLDFFQIHSIELISSLPLGAFSAAVALDWTGEARMGLIILFDSYLVHGHSQWGNQQKFITSCFLTTGSLALLNITPIFRIIFYL